MFDSFFIAGFEGAAGLNRHGRWFDQVAATRHDEHAERDYQSIAEIGLKAARECVRWPLVDEGRGRYDFSTVQVMIDAARRHGVEVVWDLFHFGYPKGLDPFHSDFALRFAEYAAHVASFISRQTEGTLWVTPVNEPSYYSYSGGERALFAPHQTGRGFELKIALIRAAILGIDAIRTIRPDVRVLNPDPLCRVVAPTGRPDLEAAADDFNNRVVFESWDMLCGRLMPELGGSPSHLDLLGINYYWTNQWELGGGAGIDGVVAPLDGSDARRAGLGDLVRGAWERYGTDVAISETSHYGAERGAWLSEVARSCASLIREGVPLNGVCLYPILGMFDWHETDAWIPMGLWDGPWEPGGSREVNLPMLEALIEAQSHGLLQIAASRRSRGNNGSR